MNGRRVCPRCAGGFVDRVEACPDCGVALVEPGRETPAARGQLRLRRLVWVVLIVFGGFLGWGLAQGLSDLLGAL